MQVSGGSALLPSIQATLRVWPHQHVVAARPAPLPHLNSTTMTLMLSAPRQSPFRSGAKQASHISCRDGAVCVRVQVGCVRTGGH